MAFRDPVRGKFRCRGLKTAGTSSASRLHSHTHASSLPGKKVKRPQLSSSQFVHDQRSHLSLSSRQAEQPEQQRWSSVAAPLRVYAPAREDTSVVSSSDSDSSDQTQYDISSIAIDPPNEQQPASASSVSTSSILAPVKADMEAMNANLRGIVGGRHPLLVQAADQIFGAGGKKLRPAIVFLASRATCACTGKRYLVPAQALLQLLAEHCYLPAVFQLYSVVAEKSQSSIGDWLK